MFSLRCLMAAGLVLVLSSFQTSATSPLLSEPSSWKSPLGSDANITQGPKNTLQCPGHTHCDGDFDICAVDLDVDIGTALFAPADGKITRQVFNAAWGGNFLVLEHGDGSRASLYMHLSGYAYASDDDLRTGRGSIPVRQGGLIGYTGTGGSGPHLHFSAMASKSLISCIGMVGIDGNTNLAAGQTFRSTNRPRGVPNPPPSNPVAPQPPVSPPSSPAADKPSLSNPGNGATLPSNTEVVLRWNPSANAAEYKVELWGGSYSRMTPCDWQSATSCRIGTMWPGTVSWRAQARSASRRESDWSDTWTFTVLAPPSATPTPTATTRRLTDTPTPTPLPAPGNLRIVAGLDLSTTSPIVGDRVTAFFRLRNVGGSPVYIKRLVAGVRGPNARSQNWNAPNVDFPAVTGLTLQPNQEYEYRQSQSFNGAGDYFAEPAWMDASDHWEGVLPYPRVWFDVRPRPISVTPPPTRMPTYTPIPRPPTWTPTFTPLPPPQPPAPPLITYASLANKRYSSLCLGVQGDSQADGAFIEQRSCSGSSAQSWGFQAMGGGYYQLIARSSGKCMTVQNGSAQDWALIIQATCRGADYQSWAMRSYGGYFQLVAKHSGQCIDEDAFSSKQGLEMQQGPCGSSDIDNQLWQHR